MVPIFTTLVQYIGCAYSVCIKSRAYFSIPVVTISLLDLISQSNSVTLLIQYSVNLPIFKCQVLHCGLCTNAVNIENMVCCRYASVITIDMNSVKCFPI